MNRLSIAQLLDEATKTKIPARAMSKQSKSKPSFGIVNSSTNGKRLTFSRAIVAELDLKDIAEIALIPTESCVLIASKLPIGNKLACKLSAKGDSKKISYNAGAVEAITKAFELNFAEHVSASYDEVEFSTFEDGMPYAVVTVYNKYPIVDGE